jgi:protein O-GlcNAc transferase
MKPTTRNDLCPCGSGKKHKHCCEVNQASRRIASDAAIPTSADFDPLLALFNTRRYSELENQVSTLLISYPNAAFAWQLLGGALQMQGKDALAAFQKVAELSPNDACAHFNLGVVLKSAKQDEEAVTSYRRALVLKPDYAEALSNLGSLLQATGQLNEAVQCYKKALIMRPDVPDTHNSLGTALKDLDQLNEAAACYRQAIQLNPNFADAHYNLGNVLKELKQFEQAMKSYQFAVKLKPDFFQALSNYGATLHELGQTEEALLQYQKALKISPYSADVQRNLARIVSKSERFDQIFVLSHTRHSEHFFEVEKKARLLTDRFPELAFAWQLLGICLHQQARDIEALPALLNAVKYLPTDSEVYYNLGITQASLEQREEAVASYRQSLLLKSDCAEAYNNLGDVLLKLGQYHDAEDNCRSALALKPNYVGALNNLGNALTHLGQLDNAVVCYRKAVEIKPDYFDAHSSLLMAINYNPPSTADYLAESVRFGDKVTKKITKRYSTWQCLAQPQKLRVGIVSGDLCNHPVGYFTESLLMQLNSSCVELIAYPNQSKEDDLTARIKPRLSEWHSLADLSDQEAAHLIHNDGVHVLLDLSGHTAKNRLPMFAWKPAPVQATWLGYFATTGIAEIDYVIGDAYIAPMEDESHFTEKIWHLPNSYLCFTPPVVDVEPSPLPAFLNHHITFGCFNNLAKMNDVVIALWARILHEIPNARLFIKTAQLNDMRIRERVLQKFAVRGIVADKLLLEGSSPRAELLAAYQRVDIALDPFPYPGGTTSVEALWMGVPVLTKRGDRFLSRMGESIMHNAGLTDWIADDEADYVAKAVVHTANLKKLAALRNGLRQQVLISPLFDASQFARNFEAALWGMWQNWQEQQGLSK